MPGLSRSEPVLEELKIDRSFVATICDDAMSACIVRAIVSLAHTLGVVVVGEGVETKEQAEALRGFGCRFAQGYFFGRPAPMHEMKRALQRQVGYSAAG